MYGIRDHSRVILDGAMGTEFERRGCPITRGASIYSIDNKELLRNIHLDYLKAGADIITTNTLTANEYFLNQYQFDYEEVITTSIKIAREVVSEYGKGMIAQVIGPCKYLIENDIDDTKLKSAFSSQVIDATDDVDYILIETMYLYGEAKVACETISEITDKPLLVTLVVDDEGKTFDGISLEEASKELVLLGAAAVGVNCVEIGDRLLVVMDRLLKAVDIPIILRPNLGKPIVKDHKKTYTKSNEEFIAFMEKASELGVKFLGGCCGTTPTHIQGLKN